MNEQTKISLEEAVAAARRLSPGAQELLAREIFERVEDFELPVRSSERQGLIRERLTQPLEAASRADVEAVLDRYRQFK